jgi:hypothetical protein
MWASAHATSRSPNPCTASPSVVTGSPRILRARQSSGAASHSLVPAQQDFSEASRQEHLANIQSSVGPQPWGECAGRGCGGRALPPNARHLSFLFPASHTRRPTPVHQRSDSALRHLPTSPTILLDSGKSAFVNRLGEMSGEDPAFRCQHLPLGHGGRAAGKTSDEPVGLHLADPRPFAVSSERDTARRETVVLCCPPCAWARSTREEHEHS